MFFRLYLPPGSGRLRQPATIDPTLDLCTRYPLRLGGPRQCGIRSLPNTSTHGQHWESNPRPSDLESNALSTWPRAPTCTCSMKWNRMKSESRNFEMKYMRINLCLRSREIVGVYLKGEICQFLCFLAYAFIRMTEMKIIYWISSFDGKGSWLFIPQFVYGFFWQYKGWLCCGFFDVYSFYQFLLFVLEFICLCEWVFQNFNY